MASLPVDVGILPHRTLDDEITEVEVAKVVATIAQRE